jgi:L-seryl-tRNA(Ser) seleniumtransferase
MNDPRRRIPSVDALLDSTAFEAVLALAPRARVVEALREVQAEVRTALEDAGEAGGVVPEDPQWYADRTGDRLTRLERPSLRPVINATGVVLHTNLGRAPLPDAAIQAVSEAAGYASLEYDLDVGGRGSRHDHCAALLRRLTGAGEALVVNNNAAAVVLALNTLARGRGAVISRGELVEIGGSFRVPEIMERSGTRVVEVGATNRTHPQDYRRAAAGDVGVILKVHRSNFRIEGYTREVGVTELARIAEEAGIPLFHDLGSGALIDLTRLGLPHEPTAEEALAAGADVVSLSGDKLLGGPQAGILLGRADLIARMRANPLCRALRPDKLTLAALGATLRLYLDPERAIAEVPVLRMLGASPAALEDRAKRIAARLGEAGVAAEVAPTRSTVGGGAYPGVELEGTAVAVSGVTGADTVAHRLRTGTPPVIARIRDGRVLLDPRTVDPAREDALIAAVREAVLG